MTPQFRDTFANRLFNRKVSSGNAMIERLIWNTDLFRKVWQTDRSPINHDMS